MKKSLLIMCALCIAAGAMAQRGTKSSTQTTAEESSTVSTSENLNGSFDLSYQAIENGFGMGITWIFNHLVLNASFLSGDTNSFVTKNEGWNVGVGGNFRHWLTNNLYIEGSAGLEYVHATLEYKVNGGKEEDSNGDMGLFLTPRIGLKLFNIKDTQLGIVAGYRWDFNKFKFDKDHTADYFTIGIVGIM